MKPWVQPPAAEKKEWEEEEEEGRRFLHLPPGHTDTGGVSVDHFLLFISLLQKYARNPFNSFLCPLELGRCVVRLPSGHTASLLTFLTVPSNVPMSLRCHSLPPTCSHIHTSLYRHFSGFRILTEYGSFRISAKPCSPAIWWWCLLWSALAEANLLYMQAGQHNQNVILLMAFCIAWWLNWGLFLSQNKKKMT